MIITRITTLAERVNWHTASIAITEFILLVLCWKAYFVFKKKLPATLTKFILIVLTLRFLLFSTPLSWYLFYTIIHDPYMDFRERDIVANKIKAFLAPPPQQKFLAVGSSQTRAIYSEFSKLNPVVGYYVIAGMAPLDYIEEYDEILRRRPKIILLHISEFDLARPIDFSTPRVSNLPLEYWPEFFAITSTVAGRKTAFDTLTDVAIANLFPETKYRFLFSDLYKQLSARTNTGVTSASSLQDRFNYQVASLKRLDVKNIPAQMTILEEFLRLTLKDQIPVVIVEGQYNPLAYTPYNLKMNQEIIEPDLKLLSTKFANVRVILRSELPQFSIDDYDDGYHVKPVIGDKFVAKLLQIIDPLY